MPCKKQTTKKYSKRSGPPYPANNPDCRGKTKLGNDGVRYKSVSYGGPHRWVKVQSLKNVKKKKANTKRKKKASTKRKKKASTKRKKKASTKRRKKASTKKQKFNYHGLWKPKPKPLSKMKRAELVKYLRGFRNAWERITKRNADLPNERLREMNVKQLRSHLKWYFSKEAKGLAEKNIRFYVQ